MKRKKPPMPDEPNLVTRLLDEKVRDAHPDFAQGDMKRRTGSANHKPQPERGVVLIPEWPAEVWEILAPIQQAKLMADTLADLTWREEREAQEAANAR